MSVIYNSKKIIPAPLVNITKQYQKTEGQENIGSLFSLQLKGKLLANKGSPTSSGTFWTTSGDPPDENTGGDFFESILRKQEALRWLFADEGKTLEFVPCSGTTPMKCNPRILNINFEEGVWVDYCDYTISVECDRMYGGPFADEDVSVNNMMPPYISEASENWQLEFNEQPQSTTYQHTFRLTHNISAKGKKFYDENGVVPSSAWEWAKTFVGPRLGYDSTKAIETNVGIPAGYAGYNHVRSETTDELGGTYSVSESWILSINSALEDFTVTTRTGVDDTFAHVTVEGTVTGLEVNNAATVSTAKYTNAANLFSVIVTQLYTRAQNYSGVSTLNTTPVVTTVATNPVTGVINYTYEYDERPSVCIAGAISESITIVDNNPIDVIAKIPVIGRSLGPVLQSFNTITESIRQVTIEVVTDPTSNCNAAAAIAASPKTQADTLFSSYYSQLTAAYNLVYTVENTDTWNPKTGRYVGVRAWVYQCPIS